MNKFCLLLLTVVLCGKFVLNLSGVFIGIVVSVCYCEQETTGTIIGIDLGTTYSCVGVYQHGKVEIIANEQGNRITPSYVAWTEDGERLIGDSAKNQAALNPENTVFDVKRLIGRRFADESVQADKKLVPYKIIDKGEKPYIEVQVDGKKKQFAPEEVSAMILVKMKEIAEKFLGEEVKRAVVTVPAYFNDAQRAATKDAGTISGLQVERIINEPTAAAIAYGLDNLDSEKNILVFDLGGGTFDVTLLTLDNGVFEVLATNGDTHLGGEDFDQRVMQHFIALLKKRDGVDISNDKRALQKLRREVERVKRTLSSQPQARLEIEGLRDGVDFSEMLSRSKFEELNQDLFKKTLKPVERVLQDAGLQKSDVDEVVLVGGSTRIPKVQALLKEFFDGKEPSKGVNPDEAVAYGAAVQGGILSGATRGNKQMDGVVLLDVTPLSLGIEMAGGVFAKLVNRNTGIPVRKSQVFSTYQDNQPAVNCRVYEGERPMVKDNRLLGNFVLKGIPPAPRGVPQIEVTFEIDSSGILQVSATDKGTGRSDKIVITSDQGRLSEKEIERMIREAEEFAEEDKKVTERVQTRNEVESYLYNLKSTFTNDRESLLEKLEESEVSDMLGVIEETLAYIDEHHQEMDAEDLNERKHEVERFAEPLMRKIYDSQDGGGGQYQQPPHGGPGGRHGGHDDYDEDL